MAVNVTNGVSVGWQHRCNINAKTICVDATKPRHYRELVRNPEGVMCGDIDFPNWRVQKGRKFIVGTIEFSPTGAIFDHIVPLLGMNELTPGASYELGQNDTLTTFPIVLDLVGSIHSLTNAVVGRWGFRGSKGSRPISMWIDYIAEDETETGLFTEDPLDIEDMYAYTDLSTFTIDGTDRKSADRLLLQVDNEPVIEYGSSVTMTAARIGDRKSLIATSTPYTTSHDDLYWNLRDDDVGKAAVIALTSAERVMTFTAAKAIGVTKTAVVTHRGEQIRLPTTLLNHRSDNAGTRVSPLTVALTAP